MTDITLLIVAIISFLIVFMIFWVEYKYSNCRYGGSYNGKDNWLLSFIKNTMKKKHRKPRDICDV